MRWPRRPGAPAAAPPSPPCALGPPASVLAALGPASLRSAALRSAGAALTLVLGLPVLVGWAAAEGGAGVEPRLAEPLPAYVTVLSGAEPADGELGRFDAWVEGATAFGIGVPSSPSGPSPRLALTRHLAATHPELVVAVAVDEHTIRVLDDWVQGAAGRPPAASEGFERAEVGAREIDALARWARAWNAGGEGHVRLIGLSTADPAPAAERVRRFLATRAPEWEARVDAAYGSLGRPRELTVGGFWFAAASAPPGDLVWRATVAFPTPEAAVDVVCTFEGASPPPLTADAVRVHKRPFRRAAVRVELGEAAPPRDVACGVTAGEGQMLRVSRMRLSAGGRPVPLRGLVADGDALTRGGGGEPRLVASPALVRRVGARRVWIRGPVSRPDPGAARALLDDMQAAADGWRAAVGAAAVDGVLADARIVAQTLALAGEGSSPSSIGYRQRISNLADAQRRAPGATFVVWAGITTIGRVGSPTVRLGASLSARLGEAYRAIAISIAPGALGAGDPGLGRPGVRAAAGSVEEALSPFGWSVMAELRHAAADPGAPPWITRGPRLRAFGTEDSPPAAPVTYWRLEEGALDVAWAVGWGASGADPGLPAGSRGTEGSPAPG